MRLRPPRPQEAVAYGRAAVAIRPGSSMAHNSLGGALRGAGDLDGAAAEYRQAIEVDPTAAAPHANLGLVLREHGDVGGAVAEFRRASELEPKGDFAHYGLGLALRDGGDPDGAAAEFRQALALNPDGTGARGELVKSLAPRGRLEEAAPPGRRPCNASPRNHDAWYGYAELCLFLGRDEDYRRNCRALLDRFGDTPDLAVAERTGRACLLLPASGADLKRAAALADRAGPPGRRMNTTASSWPRRAWRTTGGAGSTPPSTRSQQAGARRRGCPLRPVLAMALHRSGRTGEASDALAAAIQAYDWDEAKADNQDAWIAHVLCREAEELIVPNLSAFLKGGYQPKDNSERLELVGRCLFRRRFLSAARLYADAFAFDPKLADDPKSGNRHNAACCAARAGRGEGVDAKDLDEKERGRLAPAGAGLAAGRPGGVVEATAGRQARGANGSRDADASLARGRRPVRPAGPGGAGQAAGRRAGDAQDALGRRAGAAGQSRSKKVTHRRNPPRTPRRTRTPPRTTANAGPPLDPRRRPGEHRGGLSDGEEQLSRQRGA